MTKERRRQRMPVSPPHFPNASGQIEVAAPHSGGKGPPLAAHVILYFAADDGRLTLLVWGTRPDPLVSRPHEYDTAGGRGLEIVKAFSGRWGS